jgi:hypothetical protein
MKSGNVKNLLRISPSEALSPFGVHSMISKSIFFTSIAATLFYVGEKAARWHLQYI